MVTAFKKPAVPDPKTIEMARIAESPLSREEFRAIADEMGKLYKRYLAGELKETSLQKRMKSGL